MRRIVIALCIKRLPSNEAALDMCPFWHYRTYYGQLAVDENTVDTLRYSVKECLLL